MWHNNLDKRNTYVRMLFVDYSSAFNTIVSSKLVVKLPALGLNNSLCSWIPDFLTGRRQVVRVSSNISFPADPQHWSPSGLYSQPSPVLPVHAWLCSHAKLQRHQQICGWHNGGRSDHWRRWISLQRRGAHPDTLNISKTKELVVDFRRRTSHHHRRDSSGAGQQLQVPWRKHHQGSHLDYSHTVSSKKGPQRLFFLRLLKKFGLSSKILKQFYSCIVESILTGCITAWYGKCTALNRKAMKRIVQTAQHIVGGKLHSLQDIYTQWSVRKARKIIRDSCHPSDELFSLLPSGRRYSSIRTRTSRTASSRRPSDCWTPDSKWYSPTYPSHWIPSTHQTHWLWQHCSIEHMQLHLLFWTNKLLHWTSL